MKTHHSFQGKYKARVSKVINCAGEDAVIQIEEGFNVELTDNCKVKATGCMNLKPFKSGKAKFKMSVKGRKRKEGTEDICAMNKNVAEKSILRVLGAPDSCPVSAGRVCANGKDSLDISQYKMFLRFAKGTTEIEVDIDHGDDGKSCYKIIVEIYS